MAALIFGKKIQQQSRVFFGVIFYVHTYVDNRERARASYQNCKGDEFLRKKNMEAVRKWEMLAASRVKMSGSEK